MKLSGHRHSCKLQFHQIVSGVNRQLHVSNSWHIQCTPPTSPTPRIWRMQCCIIPRTKSMLPRQSGLTSSLWCGSLGEPLWGWRRASVLCSLSCICMMGVEGPHDVQHTDIHARLNHEACHCWVAATPQSDPHEPGQGPNIRMFCSCVSINLQCWGFNMSTTGGSDTHPPPQTPTHVKALSNIVTHERTPRKLSTS